MLSGVQKSREFFCVQVVYVIVKIVTPCFSKPSLLGKNTASGFSSRLVGWQTHCKDFFNSQHDVAILLAYVYIANILYSVTVS